MSDSVDIDWIRLCRIHVASTPFFVSAHTHFQWLVQMPSPFQQTEGILHNASGIGESVVENALLIDKTLLLSHWVGPQSIRH